MMGFASDIERRLFAFLSPRNREAHGEFCALIEEFPNECLRCGKRIGEHESFCGDKCQGEYEGVNHDCKTS